MPPRTRPPACEGCPANATALGFVPPSGPPDPDLVIMGQGPGEDEAWVGQPFVGKSGKMLSAWLHRAGIPRERCHISNVVWCQLPENRQPTRAEVEHCRRAHWEPSLSGIDAPVVVAVGLTAVAALTGRPFTGPNKVKMSAQGRWERIEIAGAPRNMIGLLHPSYVMRGKWAYDPVQVEFLKRAWARRGERPSEGGPLLPPWPGAITEPTIDDLHRWQATIGPQGVAVDIETAGDHIRMVGFCTIGPTTTPLVLPFLGQGGDPYWDTPSEYEAAVRWLWKLLADPGVPKVFHNGLAFDIPMLEHNGFVVAGYELDTMLLQAVAYPGMEKGLEFLAKTYLGWNGWKHLAKGETEGEDK